MPDKLKDFESELRKLLTDLVGIPVLLFWGFLSLLPLGWLFSGDVATLRYWINVFFLATGLWGVLVAYFGARSVMWSEARAHGGAPSRVFVVIYAAIWSVLYLAFFVTNR
jgi:hypothetical protein